MSETVIRAIHFRHPALPWLAAIAFLLAVPLVFSSNSALTIMNQMAMTIIFALAYNMLLGQAGLLSFGHAVYMGIGGFACVHIMNWDAFFGLMPVPVLPLFGGIFGMGLALLVGTFSTRNARTVFAMISLGVGELIAACAVIVTVFFGGEEGVSGNRTHGLPVFGIEFLRQIEVYYLTAFWLLLSTFLMYLYSLTPMGCMANAVRDNPERAEFLGYSARWVRFHSFVVSGFFAGVAGGLFAINYEIVTEENLNLAQSGTVLLVTFLGGTGVFFGPVIGAVVFTLLQTVLSLETELWQLYLGTLFVATVMFFPAGLAGLLTLHAPFAGTGHLGRLAIPYARILFPGTLVVLSLAGLAELVHHIRNAPQGEHEIVLYWTSMNSHSPIPWLVFAALALGGTWLVMRGIPGLVAVWHGIQEREGQGA